MIWNLNFFQNETQNLAKCALSKILISPNWIVKKIWHIGATINTIYKKFQNISFENSSLGKHVFWEKDPKKDNSPKCKINTLIHYMSFGPFIESGCHFTSLFSGGGGGCEIGNGSLLKKVPKYYILIFSCLPLAQSIFLGNRGMMPTLVLGLTYMLWLCNGH
jgi:hypothetical protein